MAVQILRDDWGVPHIRSDSEAEAFFGAGYAQAEDRLDDMLFSYLHVVGGLASVLGPQHLATDIQTRSWRYLEESREGYRRLQTDDPQLALDITAFVDGIAQYLADHPEKAPAWLPSLEPALPIARIMTLTWGLEHTTGWEAGGLADAARGGVKPSPPTTVDPLRGAPRASNAWALAPWRTADNFAVAVADPHNALQGSATELHLRGGDVHVCGFAFPGTPFPYVGHNDHLGWGTTVGGPDVADCYCIEVDPDAPDRYRYDDAWRQVERRRIDIEVKGADPVSVDVEYVTVNDITVPVLSREGERLYAAVGSLDNYAEGATRHIYNMLKAHDADAWLDALTPPGMFPVNLVGADTSGNIFYLRAGRVPIRPDGYDWSRPVPGNTSATAWRGIHPARDLVHLVNPTHGYLLNANNSPDVMIGDSPLTPDRYPDYIFNGQSGRTTSRGVLGVQDLPLTFDADYERLLGLLYGVRWLGVAEWRRALAKAALDRAWVDARTPPERRLLGRALAFDGEARAESVDGLAYFHWQQAIAPLARVAEIDWRALNSRGLVGEALTPAEEAVLRAAVVQAAANMAAQYGECDPCLGDVFRHGRGEVSYPVGGCTRGVGPGAEGESWNTIAMPPAAFRAGHAGPPDEHGRMRMLSGQSHPHVMIMSRPIRSYSAHPYGQSDDKASAHYSDQSILYSERRLKPTYFDFELEGHVESVRELAWRRPGVAAAKRRRHVKIFAAGLFNEANGLVATPTVPADFKAGGLWRADIDEPSQRSSATVPVERWRKLATERGDILARGLVGYAQPGGRLLRSLYESLRDELLDDLEHALPVDAVLLSMHGSMVAAGYDDSEGDIIERVRSIVGPDTPIGVELDLHCNLTTLMIEHATIIMPYKEWPHTDIAERATELYSLIAGCAEGRFKPYTAVRDCRIIGTFPTTVEPMRAFVDRMSEAEGQEGVLSVSGARVSLGGTPDMTAKVIVVTDDDPNLAQTIAERFGREFWTIREAVIERAEFTIDEAIDYGLAAAGRPIVFGDPADSLGGGNPCDSTFLLARVVERGVGDVAFGPIWDPSAVQACVNVGEGESLRLRIGGKVEPLSGDPVDLEVTVIAIRDDCTQTLDYPGSPVLQMGRVVWVKAPGDIDILLTHQRARTLSSTVFSEMGCDISGKKMVFCKMWRHGVPGFEKVAAEIHFVGCPGGNNLDYAAIQHPAGQGDYWPKVDDPFVASGVPSLL